jgi:integrase
MLYSEIIAIEIDNTKKLWIKHFETKIVMLIALMCARRRGEILKYKYENFDSSNEYTRVDVPAQITKTNVKDSFPLPTEITELIEELREIKGDESSDGLIFSSLEEHMPTLYFRKVIQQIQKRENCIVLGEQFTLHTCRHLFATIMAERKGAYLADLCISHLPPKMMRTYNNTPYKVRAEVFYEYWNLISKDS